MKFVCDQCKTKYSIDDARVRGKVLKIRCKQCNHIITVREETASRATGANPTVPKALEKALDDSFGAHDFDDNADRTQISSGVDVAAMSAAARASKPRASAAGGERQEQGDWFIAFDGVQEGPLTLDKVAQRVRAEAGKEAHAWRDGFDAWLPVEKVPEIAQKLKPREPTPARPQPSVVKPSMPQAARSPTPAPSPASERRDPSRPGTGPVRTVPSPSPSVAKPTSLPAAASAKPAPRPSAVEQPTLMDQRAPTIAGRGSPAAAFASAPARAPALDATPAPLPAPPVVERATPMTLPTPTPTPLPTSAPHAAPHAPSTASAPHAVSHAPSTASAAHASPSSSSPGIAVASTAPARPDPTPAPLPAPPKSFDLVISEPSIVAHAPPPNGHSAAPSPVVIITGPAPRHQPWLKWAIPVGGAVIVLLLATVGYLLFGRKPTVVASVAPPPAVVEKAIPVDDKPATLVDSPSVPTPSAAIAQPPIPTGKEPHGSKQHAPAQSKTQKLNANQTALQQLYGDADKSTPTRDLPSVPRPEEHKPQFTETQLREVLAKNKQSLTYCYDRALKRDGNQLKSARIDVEVKVGISGSVTRVSLPDLYANTEIGTCLNQAIKRWRFPSQDAEYSTSFPLLLQAQ